MHLISLIETPQQSGKMQVLINPAHIITVTANHPVKQDEAAELYIKFQGETRFRTYEAVDPTGHYAGGGCTRDDLLRFFKSYVRGEIQS